MRLWIFLIFLFHQFFFRSLRPQQNWIIFCCFCCRFGLTVKFSCRCLLLVFLYFRFLKIADERKNNIHTRNIFANHTKKEKLSFSSSKVSDRSHKSPENISTELAKVLIVPKVINSAHNFTRFFTKNSEILNTLLWNKIFASRRDDVLKRVQSTPRHKKY